MTRTSRPCRLPLCDLYACFRFQFCSVTILATTERFLKISGSPRYRSEECEALLLSQNFQSGFIAGRVGSESMTYGHWFSTLGRKRGKLANSSSELIMFSINVIVRARRYGRLRSLVLFACRGSLCPARSFNACTCTKNNDLFFFASRRPHRRRFSIRTICPSIP